MANLFLFTGENSYALREEKMRWIGEFEKKYGADNIVRLDGAKLTLRILLDEVSSAPFIAPRRLVVIDGMPKLDKDELHLLVANIHPDTLVLICDGKIDKRTTGGKEILKLAEVKEFASAQDNVLRSWAAGLAQRNGSAIAPDALAMLFEMLGPDQDMLSQEILKLSLYSGKAGIRKTDVEEMTVPTAEGVVWKLSDLLSAGRKQEALVFAKKYLDRGGDAYGLWAILLNMLKNVVAIYAVASSGTRDMKEVADRSGVNFFAVKSILPQAGGLKAASLKNFLSWAVQADIDLKTGALRATDEFPQEILALVDRFLLSYPSR